MTKKIIKPKTKQKSIRFPLNLVELIEESSHIEKRSFGNSVIKIVEDHYKTINTVEKLREKHDNRNL